MNAHAPPSFVCWPNVRSKTTCRRTLYKEYLTTAKSEPRPGSYRHPSMLLCIPQLSEMSNNMCRRTEISRVKYGMLMHPETRAKCVSTCAD